MLNVSLAVKSAFVFAAVSSVLLVMNIVQLMNFKSVTRELSLCTERLQTLTRQQRLLAAVASDRNASADDASAVDVDLEERAAASVRREREFERAKCADIARQFASLRVENEALVRTNLQLERAAAVAARASQNDTCGADVRAYVADLNAENGVLRATLQRLIEEGTSGG
jgi:hypothetical protein